MKVYLLKRLLLIIPTLFGILLINFIIAQIAPGGPVDQMLARFSGFHQQTAISSIDSSNQSAYEGAKGLDPELIEDIKKQFGFDKPAHVRFFEMLKNYLVFDFGKSFYRDDSVLSILIEKLPVSISLGLWSTLLIYLISIPLGIHKAVRHGSSFDILSSFVIIIAYAIPSFLFAILMIVLFCGGNFWDLFPLRGLVSDNFHELIWPMKIIDYFWHITLPVMAIVLGGFAGLTMLTKNTFLEEINKQYVLTARAKGLSERRVLYGHIFRNAMLVVIAGFPSAFVGIFFTGSLLIEVIFSLDGLGLLGFESAVTRDYPVMFGVLYLMTLIGLILNIIGDLTYVMVDPRIHFGEHT